MLPRWFRVVLAAEIAGLATFVVVGVHVLGQGVHSAGTALTWLRPAPHARSAPHSLPLPPLLTTTTSADIPPRALYGAALLTPSLLVRLNRDTGAAAIGEYTLLLNLEALARDEVTKLLGTFAKAGS
jgi:hypothetical protein